LRAIFISYRRNDAEGEAGRLFDDLAARFSEKSVFMDVDAIKPGYDFRKAIDESIDGCSVLLAIIGPTWYTARNQAGEFRLEQENDFVRLEIGSALRRRIPVIPVLVRGTKMPTAEELPVDLKDLAYRNAVELTHARWKSDVQLLISALGPYIEVRDETSSVNSLPADPSQPNPSLRREPTAAFSNGDLTSALPSVSKAPQFDPDHLGRLGKELASHIGPIAEIMVKRAAKKCASVSDLYETLAREIETESDRNKFLAFCRR